MFFFHARQLGQKNVCRPERLIEFYGDAIVFLVKPILSGKWMNLVSDSTTAYRAYSSNSINSDWPRRQLRSHKYWNSINRSVTQMLFLSPSWQAWNSQKSQKPSKNVLVLSWGGLGSFLWSSKEIRQVFNSYFPHLLLRTPTPPPLLTAPKQWPLPKGGLIGGCPTLLVGLAFFAEIPRLSQNLFSFIWEEGQPTFAGSCYRLPKISPMRFGIFPYKRIWEG